MVQSQVARVKKGTIVNSFVEIQNSNAGNRKFECNNSNSDEIAEI